MNMMRPALKIELDQAGDELCNLQQMISIELALGICLPPRGSVAETWPTGLATQWNDAAAAGAFDHCPTLGHLAKAFLRYRLEKLA